MGMIRIAGTEFSLKHKSFEIYIQGCWRGCRGCHNPDTHPFEGGREVNITDYMEELADKIYPFKDLVKNIYVSGGDLLCHPYEIAEEFSNHLKYNFHHSYMLWLFTGAGTYDRLPDWIWWYYDIVKCGMFKIDELNPEGSFPASKNQTLICGNRVSKELFDSIDFKGEKIWQEQWKEKTKMPILKDYEIFRGKPFFQ